MEGYGHYIGLSCEGYTQPNMPMEDAYCPPKAEVRGSNPFGRAISFSSLRIT